MMVNFHPRLSWLGLRFTCFRCEGEADMPAYVQHHQIETAAIICPGCIGLLPMYVRDVEPHWSMAKIDFIYECSDCGAEVRQTVTKPERRH
jgi:DNA-directed RNA polymerase subunit RPC12/RpoP